MGGQVEGVSAMTVLRYLMLADVPVSSSWVVDDNGYIWEQGERPRRRPGRARQRAVIRDRVVQAGTTTPRSYSMEDAREELRRRLGR